jgi:cell division protease FtsH
LLPGASETSQQTQWLIDQEVQHLVDTAHAEVTRLLTSHRAQLDGLAHALLVAETLDGAAAYAAAGVKMPAPPEIEPEPEPESEAGTAPATAAEAQPTAEVGATDVSPLT